MSLSDCERTDRLRALSLARLVVGDGAPVGHYLSTARQFFTFLASGVSQTGPNNTQSVQVLAKPRTMVRVDVEGGVDEELADRIRDVVRAVVVEA